MLPPSWHFILPRSRVLLFGDFLHQLHCWHQPYVCMYGALQCLCSNSIPRRYSPSVRPQARPSWVTFVPSDTDTLPACLCAALSAGRFLMPCIPLGLPASTQVPQSRVSPVLDPVGYSSHCFCPLQNFLYPIPCSSRTPFLKLQAHARCDFL